MAIGVGGSQNLGGSDGGDKRRMLPPKFPANKTVRSPYQGFRHPPLYDPGRGHNLPLVPDTLRIGMFEILEDGEFDDYLLCKGYDPDTKKFLPEVKIAKPHLLQRTPFHGETVTLRDMEVSYEYQEQIGLRLAQVTASEEDGDTLQEFQRITEDYYKGDILQAIRARRSRSVDNTEWPNEEGVMFEWVDLNASGRAWAVTKENDSDQPG